MNRREAERFLTALGEVRATGQQAAVATVVRVHGSAYRREGARMLVRPDGTYECALSGGCLEPAVADAAARVIATGEPATVSYDLADDSIWSLNIGCSGAVDIRIERLDDDEVTRAWLDALQHGHPVVLVTALSGGSGRRVIGSFGPAVGRLSSKSLEVDADARAADLRGDAHSVSVAEQLNGVELFFDVSHAAPELFVFGAGQDAIPLAAQAWTLGFNVTVIDSRAAFLRPELFAGARLVLGDFEALAAALALPRGAFVAIMNHHLERDRHALRFALDRDLAYVGVLGPRARFERLLGDLRKDGYEPPAAVSARVHSPIGLAIGAETPEEVAVAILAEILAIRRGFAGGFLAGSTASLHRPAAIRAAARS
jgi:xanthine/CO dehydrogenase XdhC/CoxF family maturation factor